MSHTLPAMRLLCGYWLCRALISCSRWQDVREQELNASGRLSMGGEGYGELLEVDAEAAARRALARVLGRSEHSPRVARVQAEIEQLMFMEDSHYG